MDVELVLELLFLMLVVCSRVVFAHLRRVNWGPERSWATNSCISLQTAFFSRMPWPLVAVGEFASVLDARAVLRFWMPEQCFDFGCQSSASVLDARAVLVAHGIVRWWPFLVKVVIESNCTAGVAVMMLWFGDELVESLLGLSKGCF